MRKLLSTSDVYDFYGLTLLSGPDHVAFKERRRELLLDIKKKYVKSLKDRIKLEAKLIGLDIVEDSIEAIVKKVSEALGDEIAEQAEEMRIMNRGFNVMRFLDKFHNKPQPTGLEVAPGAFRSDEGKKMAMYGGEPWAQISEAFLAIERSETDSEIILAIDALNSLQHNTNYVLFDIAGVAGVEQIQDIMQEKFTSGPKELADHMSSSVKKLLVEAKILDAQKV